METACSSVTAWCEGSSIMSVRIEEKERIVVAYGKTIDFLIKIPTTVRQIIIVNRNVVKITVSLDI